VVRIGRRRPEEIAAAARIATNFNGTLQGKPADGSRRLSRLPAQIAASSSPMLAPTSVRINAAPKNALTLPERLGARLTTPTTKAADVEARKAADACQSPLVSDAACHSSESTAETTPICIAAKSVFLKHAMQAITPGTQPASGRLSGTTTGHTHPLQVLSSSGLLRLVTDR
jgi:hypothetical protein